MYAYKISSSVARYVYANLLRYTKPIRPARLLGDQQRRRLKLLRILSESDCTVEEVVQTIERLQQTFEDMAVRGLRSCGPEQVTALSSLHDELNRIGAAHMAGRLEDVITKIRNDDRGSARALMRAQASLRVFERLLTLGTVGEEMARLQAVLAGDLGDDDDNDDDNDNEEDVEGDL